MLNYRKNAPFGLRPLNSLLGMDWVEKVNAYEIYASPDGTQTYEESLFQNDPVVLYSGANPGVTRRNTIRLYDGSVTDGTPSTVSTTPLLGVFQGCEYTDSTGRYVRNSFWPARTQILPGSRIRAFVIDDPNVVFVIQASTYCDILQATFFPSFLKANALNVTALGSNFALSNHVNNFNNPHYGNNPMPNIEAKMSSFYLNAAIYTAGEPITGTHDYDHTLATLPLKVIGLADDVRNFVTDPGVASLDEQPFLRLKVIINNHQYKVGTVGPSFA